MKVAVGIGLLLALSSAPASVSADPLKPVLEWTLTAVHSHSCPNVAWADEDRVLIACDDGAQFVRLKDGAVELALPREPIPDGMLQTFDIDSDGKVAVAFSPSSPAAEQFGFDLIQGKRIFARRGGLGFAVRDIALRGDSFAVLAWKDTPDGTPDGSGAVVWEAPLRGGDWVDLATPLHVLETAAAVERVQFLHLFTSGALDVGADGTLAVITTLEPGIFLYPPKGGPPRVLFKEEKSLVLDRLPEIYSTYRKDLAGRYREIINQGPMVDGLVLTPRGPVVVVRRAAGDQIRWDLWLVTGASSKKVVPLAMSSPYMVGHAGCDSRGMRLVCVVKKAVDQPWGEQPSAGGIALAVFDLEKAYE